MPRFTDELIARVRRAGATGELTLRADLGVWSAKTIKTLRRHRVRSSITVRKTKPVRAAIAAIDEDAWTDIAYPDTGTAQVAETRLQGDRLIVRRVRHLHAQAFRAVRGTRCMTVVLGSHYGEPWRGVWPAEPLDPQQTV